MYKVTIIVVDNGSKDGTFDHIRNNYASVLSIAAESNLGFGQGNNLALRIAIKENADYVFLLNQDAWITKDTIEKLVAAHQQYPQYGIISPVHLNGAGNDFDDHFFNYLTKSDIKEVLLNKVYNEQGKQGLIDAPFVNAAAWLITKSCLHKVGGFDPIFFHYGEDDNYGQRVRYKGFKIGILLSTEIFHDKERPPLNKKTDIKKIISRDWTQFLVYVCDVENKNYKMMMVKRAVRHSLNFIAALASIKKEKASYNFSMLQKILTSFGKVKKSQAIAASDSVTPYL